MGKPEPKARHKPEDNENYRKAHAYMNAYVDSLVDEYKSKKENAFLAECVDRLAGELRGIRNELSEIREQNAALAKNAQFLDFTRLTVGMSGAEPPARNNDELRSDGELYRVFEQHKQNALPENPLYKQPIAASVPEPPLVMEPPPVPVTDTLPVPEPPLAPEPTPAPEPPEKKPKNKAVTIISNVLFYACMVMLIVGAVTFAQSDDVNKSLFGFRYYYIKSNSMEPKYPVGSVVFTKITPPEDIGVNDVITMYIGDGNTDSYLTHRVVEVIDNLGDISFRTKGDNSKTNDPTPFEAKLVVGRVVFCVPMLGTIMNFIQDQLILVVGIFVLLIALSFMLRLLLTKEEPEEVAGA